MTTNQTSTGSKIKSLISDNSKDYFKWLKDPEEQEKKEKLNYLVSLIENYRGLAFVKRYPSEGFENLTEHVYTMLGQKRWQDKVSDYRYECQHLLEMLAIPEVSKAITSAKYSVNGLVGMTSRLLDFFQTLELHPYQTLLLSQDIQSFGTDYKEKEIQELIEEYEARLEAAANGKIRFY